MLGQAIVAAGRHAPERRAVAGDMLFLRGADAGTPLHFELDELSAGRTFTGLAVQVLQEGRCCAAGTLLLDTTAPAVVAPRGRRAGRARPLRVPAHTTWA